MIFSLPEIKFADFKLFDLKHRGIQHNFYAESEDRLTPFKGDKLE